MQKYSPQEFGLNLGLGLEHFSSFNITGKNKESRPMEFNEAMLNPVTFSCVISAQ